MSAPVSAWPRELPTGIEYGANLYMWDGGWYVDVYERTDHVTGSLVTDIGSPDERLWRVIGDFRLTVQPTSEDELRAAVVAWVRAALAAWVARNR